MSTKYNDYYKEFINDIFTNEKKGTIDDFNNEELNHAIELTLLKEIKTMNQKQNTIKNIMTFWFTLTIINLLGVIYLATKIGNLIN